MARGHAQRQDGAHTGELRRDLALTERLPLQDLHLFAARPL